MLKRRYIKRMYIEEAICDKCGSKMEPTGMVLMSYPAQYPYECSNPACNGSETFRGEERPGELKFEFEDEEDV